MSVRKLKETLAGDISQWLADGLIDTSVYEVLARRYDLSAFTASRMLSYLGILGGLTFLLGVLGVLAALAQSLTVGIVILGGLAAAAFVAGIRLARDPLNRYPFTSKTLVAAAFICYGGALALIALAFKLTEQSSLVFIGLAWLIPAFAASYACVNRFILTLSVIGMFHWVGSWNQMIGRSTYAFAVQDPLVMTGFAVLVVTAGCLHELYYPDNDRSAFSSAYMSVGLLYFNMSLLILGIFDENKLPFVIAGIIASVGQILIGSWLKRSIITGFGVTFAGIHLFTRYYEGFWSNLDKGIFFLAGGAAVLAAGMIIEWLNGRKKG